MGSTARAYREKETGVFGHARRPRYHVVQVPDQDDEDQARPRAHQRQLSHCGVVQRHGAVEQCTPRDRRFCCGRQTKVGTEIYTKNVGAKSVGTGERRFSWLSIRYFFCNEAFREQEEHTFSYMD